MNVKDPTLTICGTLVWVGTLIVQSREKVLVRGCEKFLPALA